MATTYKNYSVIILSKAKIPPPPSIFLFTYKYLVITTTKQLYTHISMIMNNLTPSFLNEIRHTFHSDF